MLTEAVRAASTLAPLISSHSNMPKAAARIKPPTNIVRQIRYGERIGATTLRGMRCMMPGSLGSRASTSPSTATVTMLIHRICTGRIGKAIPSKMANKMIRPSPRLVGSVQEMILIRLS